MMPRHVSSRIGVAGQTANCYIRTYTLLRIYFTYQRAAETEELLQ